VIFGEPYKSLPSLCAASFRGQLTCRTTQAKRSTNGGPKSLIDFGGDLEGQNTSATSKDNNNTGNLLDDLAGLSFQSNPAPFGQGGSISLGHDTSSHQTSDPCSF
jgi:hypothetical protein